MNVISTGLNNNVIANVPAKRRNDIQH
jgi:hypothetical protein